MVKESRKIKGERSISLVSKLCHSDPERSEGEES